MGWPDNLLTDHTAFYGFRVKWCFQSYAIAHTHCDCAVVCSADEDVNRLALGLTTDDLADGDDVQDLNGHSGGCCAEVARRTVSGTIPIQVGHELLLGYGLETLERRGTHCGL